MWTGWSQRWATIPHLGTWLDSVSLGLGVAAGETQSESPLKSRPIDEVMSVLQAQGGEFEKEVEPLSPLLCEWGSGVRL